MNLSKNQLLSWNLKSTLHEELRSARA
jgi:hypothetical protein